MTADGSDEDASGDPDDREGSAAGSDNGTAGESAGRPPGQPDPQSPDRPDPGAAEQPDPQSPDSPDPARTGPPDAGPAEPADTGTTGAPDSGTEGQIPREGAGRAPEGAAGRASEGGTADEPAAAPEAVEPPAPVEGGTWFGVDAVTVVGLLPVVGYGVFLSYSALLLAVLGPDAHPLVLLGVPELLFGVVWVAALRTDRAALAAERTWAPSRLWYVPGFLLGATVLASPLVSVAYFYRRRSKVGRPTTGWVGVLRRALPGAGGDAEGEPTG